MDSDKARVVMTLTSPACPYGPTIIQEVRDVLFTEPFIREVEIKLVFDPPWSVAMISHAGRERLFANKHSLKGG
jgi:metal-sulfur cluster biosynthetic enzyme